MRYKTLAHRDGWEAEERRRVEDGLAEARRWQAIEPHKTDFWKTFWGGVLEVHYPEWKWQRQPQTDLAQFCDD
jgi:hypothetical protein